MSSYKIVTYPGQDAALEPYKGTLFVDFVHTLRAGNDWFKLIDQDKYYAVYKKYVPALLEKKGVEVRLACLTEDLDVCLGWCIHQGPILHYLFVRKDQRRQGIGTELAPKNITTLTHLTWQGQLFRNKRLPKSIFDPFIT